MSEAATTAPGGVAQNCCSSNVSAGTDNFVFSLHLNVISGVKRVASSTSSVH